MGSPRGTPRGALCHALCEVNERDAMSLYYTAAQLRPAVDHFCHGDLRPGRSDGLLNAPIDHDSLPYRAARVLRRLEGPVCRLPPRPDLGHGDRRDRVPGGGTTGPASIHRPWRVRQPSGRPRGVDPGLDRGRTESSRLHPGGPRGSPDFAASPRLIEDPDHAYGSGRCKPFDAVLSREHPCIVEDVNWILGRFRDVDFGRSSPWI